MTFTQRERGPTKEELIKLYKQLEEEHEHHVLPLETRLPDELKVHSRDQYRIIMTMILCQQTADKPLTESLAKLFKRYPNFEELRQLAKDQIQKTLSGLGIGFNNPDGGGNGARLWSLMECYFKKWGETITKENIASLRSERGFGHHFARLVPAYSVPDNTVIPLDTPAFRFLRAKLPDYSNFKYDDIRKDIEDKLGGEDRVSLIDFHEMLRYRWQTREGNREDVIIGWNAWRLLCSQERDRITKDWKWIRAHLVKDDNLAKELWKSYHEIISRS